MAAARWEGGSSRTDGLCTLICGIEALRKDTEAWEYGEFELRKERRTPAQMLWLLEKLDRRYEHDCLAHLGQASSSASVEHPNYGKEMPVVHLLLEDNNHWTALVCLKRASETGYTHAHDPITHRNAIILQDCPKLSE